MALDTSGTILTLTGIGLPNYSARGITQSLEPIQQAMQMMRSVNGTAVDLSAPQFRKYRSTIGGNDQRPIASDGQWPGKIVEVGCVHLLSYLTSGGSPARPVVSGSSFTEGDYTFYRPLLTMIVLSMTGSVDEWAADQSWQMELEEV